MIIVSKWNWWIFFEWGWSRNWHWWDLVVVSIISIILLEGKNKYGHWSLNCSAVWKLGYDLKLVKVWTGGSAKLVPCTSASSPCLFKLVWNMFFDFANNIPFKIILGKFSKKSLTEFWKPSYILFLNAEQRLNSY